MNTDTLYLSQSPGLALSLSQDLVGQAGGVRKQLLPATQVRSLPLYQELTCPRSPGMRSCSPPQGLR